MGLKSFLSKPFASYVIRKQKKWSADPAKYQQKVFDELVRVGKNTAFGKDHDFASINNHEEFKKRVPIRDYEGLKSYFDRVVKGEPDVLWKGKPTYFAKTSGTTSGTKYIPITKESIPNHINSARNALLNYIYETGNSSFLKGNLIFLSGSPEMYNTNGVLTGRLSGIVNHHVPGYLRTNQLPSYETNCIEDWEEKLAAIVKETKGRDMTLISGIPPWVQMYFDYLKEETGKKAGDLFPNFSLFVYGGVNFEPYRAKLFESIGRHVDSIETYPASEGFIAYQDKQGDKGLLLLVDSGIFFEFIPAEEVFNENPTRLSVDEVELDKNYAIIINSNAGLWGYNIGDTVKFVSKYPHRIQVTGRIKHFISAFGEHVIGEEVEKALAAAVKKYPEVEVVEFTVAPQVTPDEGLPLHEWYVEFDKEPLNLQDFENEIDNNLRKLNTYYDDLIKGNILQKLKIRTLKKNAFIEMMRQRGKLGGQNKVPRLANDRSQADELQNFLK
ncbi:GH3 auxin-responsive promoter family protein [Marinigracilibium pacificum]|uniref:GH3 auxin-responsive promoter family protein n=1 Tax=Marinigracilibium pacificum TaxID=2729599 RepID=A0A848J1V9_9BACT|nr:GH3 auxin-responsive promoter family protein [Marinigracilibium pacificum]NMM49485.1 GH3 auxin-responsive promoter family protein [Marinigracilibium pacificum]